MQSGQMSILMKSSLFGSGMEKLRKRKIVYQSKEVTIFHIASLQKLKALFTVAGSGVMHHTDAQGCQVYACGKVVMKKNGLRLTGFVVNEHASLLTVLLENNKEVEVQCLIYCEILTENSKLR
eukprot:9490227-Ditylum_brightwellii.AAC.1